MIRAILWKEFREQGLIALTLLVLGAGVLVAAANFADPPAPDASPADVLGFLGAGRLATLLLAVTAGTVCGGALFAAEREAGTMGFLAALPVSRWRLWQAKVVAGVGLLAIQVGVLLAVAVGLGLVETRGWVVAVAVYSVLAFAWGVYGSTLARTTLGSVGVAVPAAVVAAVIFLFLALLVYPHHGHGLPRMEAAFLFLSLMLVTPVGGSAVLFTRQDRDRAADDPTPAYRPPPAPGSPAASAPVAPVRSKLGLKALLWLAVRQLASPGEVVSGFAITFGMVLLLPSVQPVLAWPGLALAAGVLAGVMAFADEQGSGNARFWGERRLPVGRAWAVKVGVHAAFALWLALLVALPLTVRAVTGGAGRGDATLAAVFRAPLFDTPHLGGRAWMYLLVPVGYGFAAGLLCGLLFRKTVVAAGMAGVVGGTAAAMWLPSLLSGGVRHWQLWLPPAAAVATSRLLMRAWASDRMATRGALTTLGGGVGAVVVLMAAGIGWRVLELPVNPAGEDDQRYVPGLTGPEVIDSGRAFRTAAEQFRVAEGSGDALTPPGAPRTGPSQVGDVLERLPSSGWPTIPPELADPKTPEDRKKLDDLLTKTKQLEDWLNQVYESDRPPAREPWFEMAAQAARQPTGVFEDPQLVGDSTRNTPVESARLMGLAVLARGLRRQAEGDPAAFPAALRTDLALARSLRNGSRVAAFQAGAATARAAYLAADRWLAALAGRPDLIRDALAAALEDDRTVLTRWSAADGRVEPAHRADREPNDPFDPTPHLLAERYVAREQVKAPGQWLQNLLAPNGDKEAAGPIADLIGFAWSVPWERERTRRLVGLYTGGFELGYPPLQGRPGGRAAFRTVTGTSNPSEMADADLQLRTLRRATLLRLAARLYQAEKGQFPPDAAALVPRYLPAVPTDPFDGQPFRYRVAGPGGELFAPLPRPGSTRQRLEAAPGQPFAWSVGRDHKDAGGHNHPGGSPTAPEREPADDILFLVPLPLQPG